MAKKFSQFNQDTTPSLTDFIAGYSGSDNARWLMSAIGTLLQASHQPPQGYMINGKIVTSVSSNNLTVAIKTLAGNDPSASDPVYVRIGNTVRTISSALSVTKNAGTNWFNSGSADLATNEIDYFVYLGYNATDGVTIGFARIPWARVYGDFSATSTNDKYCAISTITNAASTDEYEVVGRFNATLSASASYNWSIPGTSVIVSRPIFNTRTLTYTPAFPNITVGNGTLSATYLINNRTCDYQVELTHGSSTSVGSNPQLNLPITSRTYNGRHIVGYSTLNDANTGTPYWAWMIAASATSLQYVYANVVGANVTLGGITATTPVTWTTSDSFITHGTYDLA